MEAAFVASDATGAWNWKTAYDACEAATVLFLRRYGAAMRAKAASPAAMLRCSAGLRASFRHRHVGPRKVNPSAVLHADWTGIRRSVAAAITPVDVVLEPSPAPAFLPSLLNSPAPRSFSTNLPRVVPASSRSFFRHLHDQV